MQIASVPCCGWYSHPAFALDPPRRALIHAEQVAGCRFVRFAEDGTLAAPVALGVTAGAVIGSRVLRFIRVEPLRVVFVIILILIAVEMGWRAISGI